MYFIDVQGTLIDDENRLPIDGAIDFIDKLNNSKTKYLLITNNTKHKSTDFFKYLVDLGFNIQENNYFDALMNIKSNIDSDKIFAIGNQEFIEVLKDMGFCITKDNPTAVIVGLKEDLTNSDMADAIELIMDGSQFIVMHQTTIYAKNSRRYPGLGAIAKAIEFATNKAPIVIGKPSNSFYEISKNILKAENFNDITIISDDPKGDLIGAKKLGMKTIFVLTGKYKNENEIVPFLTLKPDLTINSIKELL
jgi:NagD protein